MRQLLYKLIHRVSNSSVYIRVFLLASLIAVCGSVGVLRVSAANTINFHTLDQQDMVNGLLDYIEKVHSTGPNSNIDLSKGATTNYASYSSSAGIQQPVTVYPSGQTNSPAIIYFPSTDGTGDPDAASKLARGAGDSGGVGANARGFTVIQMGYGGGLNSIFSSYEDALLGVLHVIENGSLYGIDPKKVVLMGDSDGANLAMRVGASGRSGARAVVAWSPQTNMFTGLFKSMDMLQTGLSKMSCLGGVSPNLSELQQILTKYNTTADPSETISQSIQASSGAAGQNSSSINISAQTFDNCINDFMAGSPALTASPDTPPTLLAGFDSDPMVDPQQLYEMRDKLQSLGIQTSTLITQGPASSVSALDNYSPDATVRGRLARFVRNGADGIIRAIFPEYGKGAASGVRLADTTFDPEMCPNSPQHTVSYLNSRPSDIAIGGSPFRNVASIPFPIENLFGGGSQLRDFAQTPGISLLNEIRQMLRTGKNAFGSATEQQILQYCLNAWPKPGQDNCPNSKYPYATPAARANNCPHLGYDPDYLCRTLNFVSDVTKSYTEVVGDCVNCPQGFANQGAASPDPNSKTPLQKCVMENNH